MMFFRRGAAAPSLRARSRLTIEPLEARCVFNIDVVISEFLASNAGSIQDEDGEFSDWIELHNQGTDSVNLAGWRLTDDPDDLAQWSFPAVEIEPGEYLVVFASDKNRAVAGAELHTNFRLSADGEYLALVAADGTTIASQFSPAFPPQVEDISYGVSTDVTETVLLDLGTESHVLVPNNGALGTAWTLPGFMPDGAWQFGPLAVGYYAAEAPPVSTTVLQVDFNGRDVPNNTQSGFSPFVIDGAGIVTSPVTRTYGSLSVTLSETSGLGYDDRRRTDPTNSGAFSDGLLLQDFVFSRDNVGNGGLDVLIEGLAPNAVYTLSVWSFDTSSAGVRVSDWTANGVVAISDYAFDGNAVPPAPASNDIYKFGVVVTADAMGNILLAGRRDEASGTFGVFLNALRVETGDTINPPPGIAELVRVDFNDRTTGESGAANTEPGFATMSLDENSAAIGGLTFTLSALGGAVLDDTDRATPAESGSFTLDQLYDDFVFANGPAGGGMELLVQGLVPGAQYDVALRSYDSGSVGVRQSIWTEESSGASVTIASPYVFQGETAPASNDAYVMRASLTASPQGTLLLRGVQVSANRSVVLNSIELTRATIDELVGLDLESQMADAATSAYVRTAFAVGDLAEVDRLLLDIRYDAGFVAYLNGQEVVRRNAPTSAGVPPLFNGAATLERSTLESLDPETIDLSVYIPLLTQGAGNVLAIHGFNSASSDNDFLIAPRLRAIELGSQSLRFFDPPTPGAANVGGVVDFVAATQFSAPHGFFDSAFPLTLSTATADAAIYYTTDGSVPAPDNGAAVLYVGPIVIDTTTVLRAAAYKNDFAPSPAGTQTYIFLDDVLTQNPINNPNGLVYPTLWQANAVGDYSIDPEVVATWDDNNPANADFGIREALLSLPTMSIVMDHDDLWNASSGIYPNATSEGDAWRRPGSIEYIDPNTGERFQFNVGVQMHGNASRDNVRLKKHSFRLVFSGEFGGPGKLEFPLFDNSDFADINTVVMRASFTDSFATRTATDRYSPLDSMYMRDVWMRDTQLAMGSLAPDSTYVHLYINGLYWGLYSPAERTDDAFLESRIGGAREDWDIIRDFNELYRGEKTAWIAMFALADQLPGSGNPNAIYWELQGRNPDGTINPALPVYLDVDNLIDYMILHLYAGVEDWPSHNWVAARNRVDPGAGFQFFTWDQEIALDGRYRDRTQANNAFTPAELYYNLRSSPEFRLRFADRVQEHMFNDGALTVAANRERWLARADQIEAAIIGESARWGDAREGEVVTVSSGQQSVVVPTMTVNHWRAERDNVHDNYFPTSQTLAVQRFLADGLMSTTAAPVFSQHGGVITPGFSLSISAAAGAVYYTLDGSDPRMPGGGMAPGALLYTGAIALAGSTPVAARTLSGGVWSALVDAEFFVAEPTVRITELMYNPASSPPGGAFDAQDFEFIEIQNIGALPVNLQGMQLSAGITFSFPDQVLAPGAFAVVVQNAAAFQSRYGAGATILGQYSGRLDNGGELLVLSGSGGQVIHSFNYGDDDWYPQTDGPGFSLVVVDPSADPASWGFASNWRPSTNRFGSPGAIDPLFLAADVNQDGSVDIFDVAVVSNQWGQAGPLGDANSDGVVDIFDVAAISGSWGQLPGGGGGVVAAAASGAVAEQTADQGDAPRSYSPTSVGLPAPSLAAPVGHQRDRNGFAAIDWLVSRQTVELDRLFRAGVVRTVDSALAVSVADLRARATALRPRPTPLDDNSLPVSRPDQTISENASFEQRIDLAIAEIVARVVDRMPFSLEVRDKTAVRSAASTRAPRHRSSG